MTEAEAGVQPAARPSYDVRAALQLVGGVVMRRGRSDESRLQELIDELHRDPTVARALGIAPVQTIQTMRMLSASDRRVLLTAARHHALPRPTPVHTLDWPNERPRVYLDSHSLKSGGRLSAHAVFQTAFLNTAAKSFYWQVIAVKDYLASAADVLYPTDRAIVASGPVTLPCVDGGPFNHNEVGYSWSASVEINGTDIVGEPGLYALLIDTDPMFPDGTKRSDNESFENRACAFFVLRPAKPRGGVLLCWPFATLFVYAGAESSYESVYETGQSKRLRRVSLHRPIDTFGEREKRDWCISYPQRLWNFIAARKKTLPLPVDPCTSFDLQAEPGLLSSYKLFVSVGHDEYWTKEMRDRVETFIASGGNAAFFNGNTCWSQIRIETLEGEQAPSQIACYKNGVEDPLSAGAPARVTALWSSSPAARPESSLTGLSFRHGSLGGLQSSDRYEVLSTHGLLGGITGKIPATKDNLLSGENDGVEVVNGTAVDVPSTFTLLARKDFQDTADASRNTLPGSAAMGTYTNNGTVFSAGAVNWPLVLDDTAVATVTETVIKILSSPTTSYNATFPTMENPPAGAQVGGDRYAWEILETGTQASALAATMRGRLYKLMPNGTIWGRSADRPRQGAWSSTQMSVPWPGATPRMCTNLFGSRLYVAAERRESFGEQAFIVPVLHELNTAKDLQVSVVNLPASQCVGLAPNFSDYYVALDDPRHDRWLLAGDVRIGRWLHRALTGDAWEGKLYAATAAGELVCREAQPAGGVPAVDMVWRKIGTVPKDTFALTAGGGRIFALSGSPSSASLHWRQALSDPPYRDPTVVFLRGGREWSRLPEGSRARQAEAWTVRANGDMAFVGRWPSVPVLDFDLATRVNDTDVFFLAYDGTGQLMRFFANRKPEVLAIWGSGSFLPPKNHWTTIAYAHNGVNAHVIFYERHSGFGIVGQFLVGGRFHFRQAPEFVETWRGWMDAGWSHIVAANAAPDGGYVLSYGQASGMYAVGRISTSGQYQIRQVRPGMWGGWTQLMPAGQTYVLFYDENGGDMELMEYVSTSRDDPSGIVRSVWRSTLDPGRSLVGVEHGLILTSLVRESDVARCETIGVREQPAGAVILRAGKDVAKFAAPLVSPYYTHGVAIGGLP